MPRIAQPGRFRCGHVCRTCGTRCILEPHAVNVMHKCEQDHVEPFDPTVPSDAFNSGLIEAEHSIYEMLREDYPDMDDAERRSMAHAGALKAVQLRRDELESGMEADIFCVCGASQKRHIGGIGRCKDGDCGCVMFAPERIQLGLVQ